MPQPALVIVNPRSGGGLEERDWARLSAELAGPLGGFEAAFTNRSGHASQLAEDAARAGRPLLIALGGDGTISEVADGVLRSGATGTSVALLPRGTGGDFRRVLELPKHLHAAAERIGKATSRCIDAGRVTYTTEDGGRASRHFVNVSSFGFSSEVAARANRSSKRLGGRASFFSATVRELIAYDNQEIMIAVDGGEPRRRTMVLGAVGNGRYFGGGMKICPDAILDDGMHDLVIVGDLGRFEIIRKIHRLYAGTHLSIDDVDGQRVRHTMTATPVDPKARIPVEIDGETPGFLPATFEVLRGALSVRF